MRKKINIKLNLTVFKSFLRDILLVLKKSWKKIIFIISSIIISLISISISESQTKNNNFELFYSSLTEITKYNEFKRTHMEIKHFNPEENNEDFRDCVFKFNYADPSYCPFSINLSISYREKSFFIVKDNSMFASSILNPRTMTIRRNVKNDLKMETLNLYMLYEQYTGVHNSEWCYISSNYANALLEEYNFDNYEKLLGKNIEVSYFVNGEEKRNSLTIRSIYDSDLGMAPFYEKIFGQNLLITFIPLYYQVDNTVLSIDLSDSLYANQNTLNFIEQNIDFHNENYIFNFYNLNDEKITENILLYDEYVRYLSFKENDLTLVFTLLSCLFILFSFVLTIYFIKELRLLDVDKNNLLIFIFSMLYFIFSLLYLVLKIINISLIQSNSIILWIVILTFYYLFFVISSKLFFKIKRGVNND